MAPPFDQVGAVAFDLDGTLVDSAPDIATAADAMLQTLGHAPLGRMRIATLIGEGVERLVALALAESTGRAPPAAELADAVECFHGYYAAHLFDRSRVYPGVVDGLRRLHASGGPLACITNKASRFALPLLEAAGLAHFFAFTLGADNPATRKPAPDLLLDACGRFGVAPAELLYVGDSLIDIAAARAAGCPVAVVDYGYKQGHSLANAHPDRIIGSLVELVASRAPAAIVTFAR